MARTTRAAKSPTTRRSAPISPESGMPSAAANAGAYDTEVPRTWIDASFNASLNMLRGIEQMQRQQVQALKNMDPSPAGDSDGAAAGIQELIGMQIAAAAEQFANLAQFSTQMLTALLDVERQWVEQMEASTADMARGWLATNGTLTAPTTKAALELPTDTSPIGLFNNAQAAMAEMTKVWVEALTHDVQRA
jgi:hypothetical protein